ncbi:MobA/MobL family protein [Cohaesibacter celericrescens]|uniref:MobA/MobL family protein n=1 Tax=Cohaesibacter celericrescens TaxID=2067669 RepID=UPI0015E09D80|nr:MobA/MobL family protein [Cohaesibacter celericrescens]
MAISTYAITANFGSVSTDPKARSCVCVDDGIGKLLANLHYICRRPAINSKQGGALLFRNNAATTVVAETPCERRKFFSMCRGFLENRAKKHTKKTGVRLGDKAVISLSIDATPQQQGEMAMRIIEHFAGDSEAMVVAAIHTDRPHNPHLHLWMVDGLETPSSARERSEKRMSVDQPDPHTKKTRRARRRDYIRLGELHSRENARLKVAEIINKIADHDGLRHAETRSLKELGLAQKPQVHEGPQATQKAQRKDGENAHIDNLTPKTRQAVRENILTILENHHLSHSMSEPIDPAIYPDRLRPYSDAFVKETNDGQQMIQLESVASENKSDDPVFDEDSEVDFDSLFGWEPLSDVAPNLGTQVSENLSPVKTADTCDNDDKPVIQFGFNEHSIIGAENSEKAAPPDKISTAQAQNSNATKTNTEIIPETPPETHSTQISVKPEADRSFVDFENDKISGQQVVVDPIGTKQAPPSILFSPRSSMADRTSRIFSSSISALQHGITKYGNKNTLEDVADSIAHNLSNAVDSLQPIGDIIGRSAKVLLQKSTDEIFVPLEKMIKAKIANERQKRFKKSQSSNPFAPPAPSNTADADNRADRKIKPQPVDNMTEFPPSTPELSAQEMAAINVILGQGDQSNGRIYKKVAAKQCDPDWDAPLNLETDDPIQEKPLSSSPPTVHKRIENTNDTARTAVPKSAEPLKEIAPKAKTANEAIPLVKAPQKTTQAAHHQSQPYSPDQRTPVLRSQNDDETIKKLVRRKKLRQSSNPLHNVQADYERIIEYNRQISTLKNELSEAFPDRDGPPESERMRNVIQFYEARIESRRETISLLKAKFPELDKYNASDPLPTWEKIQNDVDARLQQKKRSQRIKQRSRDDDLSR